MSQDERVAQNHKEYISVQTVVKFDNDKTKIHYRLIFEFPQTKLREGNAFTRVCPPLLSGTIPPGATKADGTHPTGMLSCFINASWPF